MENEQPKDYVQPQKSEDFVQEEYNKLNLYQKLVSLSKERYIDYIPKEDGTIIEFLTDRPKEKHLPIPVKVYPKNQYIYTNKIDLNDYGQTSFNLQGTYLLQSEGRVDPTATIDKDLDDTNVVRVRLNASANWQLDDLNLTLFARYIGRHHGTSYRGFKNDTTSEL